MKKIFSFGIAVALLVGSVGASFAQEKTASSQLQTVKIKDIKEVVGDTYMKTDRWSPTKSCSIRSRSSRDRSFRCTSTLRPM